MKLMNALGLCEEGNFELITNISTVLNVCLRCAQSCLSVINKSTEICVQDLGGFNQI